MHQFSVLVIGKNLDDTRNIEKLLLPYHRFETTKIEKYVQELDNSDHLLRGYDQLRDILTTFNDRFVKSKFKIPSLKQYIANYAHVPVVETGASIDIHDQHKYGYAVFDGDKLINAVKRTNPNAKWDNYTIGGARDGFFKCRSYSEQETNPCSKNNSSNSANVVDFGHIDFTAMRESMQSCRRQDWEATLRFFRNWLWKNSVADIEKLRRNCFSEMLDLFDKWQDEQEELCRRWREEQKDKPKEIDFRDWARPRLDYPETYYDVFIEFVGSSSRYDNIEDWIKDAPPIEVDALLDENGWKDFEDFSGDDADWAFILRERIDRSTNDDWFAIVDCHID